MKQFIKEYLSHRQKQKRNPLQSHRDEQKKTLLSVMVCFALIIVLLLLPTGFEEAGASVPEGQERVAVKVLEVDDSNIKDTGLVKSGDQTCVVELLQGTHKGEVYTGVNLLSGSLEQDKIFQAGDKALVLVSSNDGDVNFVSMIDHYRIHYEIWLLLAFFLLLFIFAGLTGIRAILSFIVTILIIWKVLVPFCLKGYNGILIGTIITIVLTILIIALVFGFDKRCLAASVGSIAGTLVTCVMGIFCTQLFHIHGAVMSFSESLLYSGYQNLNLTEIYMAGIFIASSGALMDLSVDITAAVHEILEKRPELSWFKATKSGMQIGKATMGTMTTTLLLAYSGGYIALLMVFMAQGTPIINIVNYKYVAAEIVHTIVGSFGLVLAAPFTAIAAGYFLTYKKKSNL